MKHPVFIKSSTHHSPTARDPLLAPSKGSCIGWGAVVRGTGTPSLLALHGVVRCSHETCEKKVSLDFPSQRRLSTSQGCSMTIIFQSAYGLATFTPLNSLHIQKRISHMECLTTTEVAQDVNPFYFYFYFTLSVLIKSPQGFLCLYGSLT